MGEVIIGKIEDMGHASAVAQAMMIGADNDATLSIAHDAASGRKRALHVTPDADYLIQSGRNLIHLILIVARFNPFNPNPGRV
jgi:hypothetical protein